MHFPIVLASKAGPVRWIPRAIRELGPGFNEKYLEERIGESPELLGLEDLESHIAGPYKAFSQLRLETPTAQLAKPDLILLTQSGHVVVVEVKLVSNSDLWGREVVAQVLDYAASLSTYEEPDLVRLFAPELPGTARFVDVIRKLFPKSQVSALADALLRRIRTAEIQVVIACDEAPDELREYVRAVSAQRALGSYTIRVIEIVPYVSEVGGGDQVLLVPGRITRTEIVMRTSIEVINRPDGKVAVKVETTPLDDLENRIGVITTGKRQPRQELLAAAAAYQAVAEPGTSASGRAVDHRKVFVAGWPGDIHYEFLYRRRPEETIRVELHFEDEEYAKLAAQVAAAVRSSTHQPPGLAWDPEWMDAGRLGLAFAIDANPHDMAAGMVALVRATRPLVDKALRG